MRTSLLQCLRALGAGALALTLLGATPVAAQSRNLYDWAWVARLGATTLPGPGMPAFPPSFSWPERLAADAAGNVFIAGVYNPDVLFGPGGPRYQAAVGPQGVINNGYLAKYTPGGSLAWTLDLSSNGDVVVSDLAVDAAGNAYVLGNYFQQLRIGGIITALAGTTSPGFLAKISPTGTLAWAITVEPDAATSPLFSVKRLAVDAATGNSAVLAQFGGQITFNGTSFAGPAGKLHALVARYGPSGTLGAVIPGYTLNGGDSDRTFAGIALAPSGDLYVGGTLNAASTIQFGTLPSFTGPINANAAGFILKIDASNTTSWVITTTGPSRQSATVASGQSLGALAIGPQGRCYITGTMIGSNMSLGPQSLNTLNQAGASGQDIFLARIAPSGTVESLVGGGGTGRVWGLKLGPQGEATIGTAGGFSWGNVTLGGPVSFASSAPTGLIQLDAAGVPQRGWQATGGFLSTALAVDGSNRPVLAGTYSGASPYTFGTQQLASPYTWNTLIARTGTTVLANRPAAQVAGLEVYPNPARHVVTVQTAKAGPVQIQLLDALGRTVRTQELSTGQTQVELAGMAPGSYTLLVRQGEARSYRHLTVQP